MARRTPSGNITRHPGPDRMGEVELNADTIRQLTHPIIKTLIGVALTILGSGIYFFIEMQIHVASDEIHVRGESRAEAKEARAAVVTAISERQDVAIEKVQIATEKKLNAWGELILTEQRRIFKAIKPRRPPQ